MRRFWDSRSGTCSYLLATDGGRQCVLIDPVLEHVPLYLGVLEELDLVLSCVLESHLHADHISAAASLQDLTGCAIACSPASEIRGADVAVDDGDFLLFGEIRLQAIATPGHSRHCLTYRWGDRLFTGDALLIGGCGRADEPEGNAGLLFDSINRRLLAFPDEYLVFPGHGTQSRWVSCIGEEKRSNPMLAGNSRDEFIALSRRRHDPLPPDMESNFAANRRCNGLAAV